MIRRWLSFDSRQKAVLQSIVQDKTDLVFMFVANFVVKKPKETRNNYDGNTKKNLDNRQKNVDKVGKLRSLKCICIHWKTNL